MPTGLFNEIYITFSYKSHATCVYMYTYERPYRHWILMEIADDI